MIHEHVLVTKTLGVDNQDETVHRDWHVTHKFVWEEANKSTEMLFGYAFQIEVSEKDEDDRAALRVLLSIVKDAIHVQELIELTGEQRVAFIAGPQNLCLTQSVHTEQVIVPGFRETAHDLVVRNIREAFLVDLISNQKEFLFLFLRQSRDGPLFPAARILTAIILSNFI